MVQLEPATIIPQPRRSHVRKLGPIYAGSNAHYWKVVEASQGLVAFWAFELCSTDLCQWGSPEVIHCLSHRLETRDTNDDRPLPSTAAWRPLIGPQCHERLGCRHDVEHRVATNLNQAMASMPNEYPPLCHVKKHLPTPALDRP